MDEIERTLTWEQRAQITHLAFKKINSSDDKIISGRNINDDNVTVCAEESQSELFVGTRDEVYIIGYNCKPEHRVIFYEFLSFVDYDCRGADVFGDGTGFTLTFKLLKRRDSRDEISSSNFFDRYIQVFFSTKFFDGL